MKKHFTSATLLTVTLLSIAASGCAEFAFDKNSGDSGRDPASNRGSSFWGNGASSWGETSKGDSPNALSEDEIAEAREKQQNWIRSAKRTHDIVKGMAMTDVQSAWGQPHAVEVAGDARFGNERWIYREGLSQKWGTKSARVIYFEEGRVIGWETVRN